MLGNDHQAFVSIKADNTSDMLVDSEFGQPQLYFHKVTLIKNIAISRVSHHCIISESSFRPIMHFCA